MARILIAEGQVQGSFTQSLLGSAHDLSIATTMSQFAARLKNDSFDLIVIDLHFDESRMFDAMHLAKTISNNADKPVICIATRISRIHRPITHSLDFTVRALGAWMFLDVHRYNGTQDPKAELLRVIERCLIGEARKANREARIDLHKRRYEIHQLRSQIEKEDWSEDVEERLVELRHKLTALLLDLCDLNMGNMSQQQRIDESRNQHDRVAESVLADEDKATRAERMQTIDELHHAVDEFRIAEREEETKKRGGTDHTV